MELTLRITDPADLSRFAGLLSSIVDVTAPTLAPTTSPVTKPRNQKPNPATPDSKTTEAIAEPTVSVATPTTPATETIEITVDQMRALAAQKGQANEGNRAKLKKIVTELGATAISVIPADRRAEFIERVNAL